MSRAFTPPDTLTQDDIRTVADVRRAVWINGLFGLGAGSVTGMAGHLILQSLQRRYVPEVHKSPSGSSDAVAEKIGTTIKKTPPPSMMMYKLLRPLPPLTKNTFLLSFLGGGALGSFVLSSTAGKNAVHMLHPIFNLGRDEFEGMTPYQIEAEKLKRKQHATDTSSTTMSAMQQQDNEQLDIQHHKQRSLHRKQSIKERIESGYSLSDTHSTQGHYHHPTTITATTEEEEEEEHQSRVMHRKELWERRQTDRRKWVRDKIESGGSLSDSHVTSGGGR